MKAEGVEDDKRPGAVRAAGTAVGSGKPGDFRQAVKEGVSGIVAESVAGRGKPGTAEDSEFCSLGIRPI